MEKQKQELLQLQSTLADKDKEVMMAVTTPNTTTMVVR